MSDWDRDVASTLPRIPVRIQDWVWLQVRATPDVIVAAQQHKDYIMREVRALRMTLYDMEGSIVADIRV